MHRYIVIVLVACSSGGSQQVTSAGAVVDGPSGSRVDVPAGAVTSPVRVDITVATAGFPALPAGTDTLVYAVTPHGQRFDVPVTISFAAPPGTQTLLTAEPQSLRWAPVPGSRRVGDRLEAKVSHFSYFVPSSAPSSAHPRLFIGDGFALRELDLADGGVRTLVNGTFGSRFITGVAVDEQAQQVYWLDNKSDALSRVPFAGGAIETVYTSSDSFSNPEGPGIDSANGIVYWAEGANIMRAQLDGGAVGVFVAGGTNEHMTGVAVAGAQIFFVSDSPDSVNRVNWDGGARVVLHAVTDPTRNPRGLAFDTSPGALFWGEGNRVMHADLGGGGATAIFTGTGYVTGVTVDRFAKHVYWTDNVSDDVKRADYDGSGVTVVYQSPQSAPGNLPDSGMPPGNFTNPQGVVFVP